MCSHALLVLLRTPAINIKQSYNLAADMSFPYLEVKSEEDLLPPGAPPGTVPTDLDQSTGLERLEILGKMQGVDIFDMRPLPSDRRGTSITRSCPILFRLEDALYLRRSIDFGALKVEKWRTEKAKARLTFSTSQELGKTQLSSAELVMSNI